MNKNWTSSTELLYAIRGAIIKRDTEFLERDFDDEPENVYIDIVVPEMLVYRIMKMYAMTGRLKNNYPDLGKDAFEEELMKNREYVKLVLDIVQRTKKLKETLDRKFNKMKEVLDKITKNSAHVRMISTVDVNQDHMNKYYNGDFSEGYIDELTEKRTHWTFCSIELDIKTITIFDSFNITETKMCVLHSFMSWASSQMFLELMKEYIEEEFHTEPFDKDVFNKVIQRNGCSCGRHVYYFFKRFVIDGYHVQFRELTQYTNMNFIDQDTNFTDQFVDTVTSNDMRNSISFFKKFKKDQKKQKKNDKEETKPKKKKRGTKKKERNKRKSKKKKKRKKKTSNIIDKAKLLQKKGEKKKKKMEMELELRKKEKDRNKKKRKKKMKKKMKKRELEEKITIDVTSEDDE
jgi:hypothetical protein